MDKAKILENAQKYLNKGRVDEAIEEYEKVLEIAPSDHVIRLKLAELYIRKEATEKALEAYRYVAEEYVKNDLYTKAIGIYKQILKIGHKKPNVYINIGKLYEKLGLMREAINQYKVVSEIYNKRGKKKEHLEILKVILEMDPFDLTYRIKLAEACYKNNFIPDSIKECRRVIKDISQRFMDKGMVEQARSKLDELLHKGFKDPNIVSLIADAYITFGENKKAFSLYQELINYYESEGMEDKKLEIIEKTENITPGEKKVEEETDGQGDEISKHLEEASVCFKYGLFDRALKEANTVLQIEPGNVSATERVADIYIESGENDKAIGSLFNIVDRYLKDGDQQNAKNYLEKILSIDKENTRAREALDSLKGADT